MHSQPLLVDMAYWKGAVAACTSSIICWDIVRATNRLTMSPTTMPRTPPLGFWRAVMRPNRMASRTDVGTCALHNLSPAWKKALRSRGMSRRGCRCSTVIPEGPPAAPLLADLTFRQNPNSSKLKSACGSGLDNSLGSGVRGWRGRLVGSLNALRVASDPGARDDGPHRSRSKVISASH